MLFVFLLLPLFAYTWDGTINCGNIDFRTIALEIGSKYPAEDFLVMRTQAEWQKVWDITQGRDISDGGFPVRAPEVDFSKYMLIVVFGGRQPEVVHNIQIESIRLVDNEVILDVTKSGPDDFIRDPMLNSPFHVVAVPKGLTGAKFVVKGRRVLTMPQEISLGE